MSRWKALPGSLDPRARQLAVHLRRVKDHSGLGMRALAARTGYSRSSWDRYLNGRALPPRQAVEAFSRACDVDPARLLALLEVAAQASGAAPERTPPPGDAGDRPEAGPDGPEGPDVPPREPVRRTRRRVLAAAVAAVVAVLALGALLLTTAPWRDAGTPAGGHAGAAPSPTGPGPFVARAGADHPCRVHRAADGLLYAGYSRTRTALIGMGSAQWTVVEAQCLLRHHGLSPGNADGLYGIRTERSVERLQKAAHLPVDGVIGEDSWGVLRK